MITVLDTEKTYKVYYGNRNITSIHPQFFEYDFGIEAIPMLIDGCKRHVNFGKTDL